MDQWQSIAERKIQEAMEAGVFDNLPHRGKPISLDKNPFEDPSEWMAHHLLQVNGFAPAWIEEARDLDESAAHLRTLLREPSKRALLEFRKSAAELNRRILSYNLKCPSPQLHRLPLDLEAEIQAAYPSKSR